MAATLPLPRQTTQSISKCANYLLTGAQHIWLPALVAPSTLLGLALNTWSTTCQQQSIGNPAASVVLQWCQTHGFKQCLFRYPSFRDVIPFEDIKKDDWDRISQV